MRRPSLIAVSLLALAVSAPSVSACNGKADVEAAFVSQHKLPWRTEIGSTSDTGIVQKQIFDYQPPDRVYRKVISGGESMETIGIARGAWTNEGAGWSEMKPELANLVISHIRSSFSPPRVTAEFACLGEVTYDGKSYLGYQTTPEKVEDRELARTIYIDPETKRPAFNIVGTPDGSGEPLLKEAYSYPTDIKIEKPL